MLHHPWAPQSLVESWDAHLDLIHMLLFKWRPHFPTSLISSTPESFFLFLFFMGKMVKIKIENEIEMTDMLPQFSPRISFHYILFRVVL